MPKSGFHVNPLMAKMVDAIPQQVFQCFSEMGRAFLQTKFLAVGSSLGNLSLALKLEKGRMLVLALKLEKGRMLGSGNHPLPPLSKS